MDGAGAASSRLMSKISGLQPCAHNTGPVGVACKGPPSVPPYCTVPYHNTTRVVPDAMPSARLTRQPQISPLRLVHATWKAEFERVRDSFLNHLGEESPKDLLRMAASGAVPASQGDEHRCVNGRDGKDAGDAIGPARPLTSPRCRSSSSTLAEPLQRTWSP